MLTVFVRWIILCVLFEVCTTQSKARDHSSATSQKIRSGIVCIGIYVKQAVHRHISGARSLEAAMSVYTQLLQRDPAFPSMYSTLLPLVVRARRTSVWNTSIISPTVMPVNRGRTRSPRLANEMQMMMTRSSEYDLYRPVIREIYTGERKFSMRQQIGQVAQT